MGTERKDQYTNRKKLREARTNINIDKAEFTDVPGVDYEYQDLYKTTYRINPMYLIRGTISNRRDFDLNCYVANSTKEQIF